MKHDLNGDYYANDTRRCCSNLRRGTSCGSRDNVEHTNSHKHLSVFISGLVVAATARRRYSNNLDHASPTPASTPPVTSTLVSIQDLDVPGSLEPTALRVIASYKREGILCDRLSTVMK